ncbi:MAG: response regulator [Chitinispirillales bacterium]|jgi:signal transduction histidine kinase|nr:response regulator [Chitinispirillales bacterium]
MEPQVYTYLACAGVFLAGALAYAAVFFVIRRWFRAAAPTPRAVLERVFGWLDVCVIVNDAESCRVLYMNPKARAHFGLTDEAIGHHFFNLLGHCCDSAKGFCPRDLLRDKPDDLVSANVRCGSDGRCYRQSGFLIEWQGSKRDAHLVYLSDVTNIVEAEKQLIEAKEAAERANSARSGFLARMSEEIRAPMNAIIGMTEAAMSSEGSGAQEDCLKQIDNTSRHLLHIIDEILDISKIEANKLELSLEVFDMENTLRRILSMLEWRMGGKKRNFAVEIGDIPRSLLGDGARLSQILVNLLSNADKFTPDGGKIALRVENLEEGEEFCGMHFEVEDSGPGVPEEMRWWLFDAFEEGSENHAERKLRGGAGLGLAISKRLVEMMGGRIWVESKHGAGAKFAFTVRFYKNKSEAGRVDIESVTASARLGGKKPAEGGMGDEERRVAERRLGERRGAVKPADWSKAPIPNEVKRGDRRVLLAEDVEVNREQITSYFEGSGIRFDLAENGEIACRMFAEAPKKYFLVLMDTQMPVMDGYEAARKIRGLAMEWAKKAPIIGMMANAFKEDIDQCLEAGMSSHVEKPLDMAALRETVLRIIDLEFKAKG